MNKKIRQRLGLHFYAVGLWRIFLFCRNKENVYHCRGDIPVFFRKICEKYDCDEKPVLDATSAIERLELSNSSLLAASLVSIR